VASWPAREVICVSIRHGETRVAGSWAATFSLIRKTCELATWSCVRIRVVCRLPCGLSSLCVRVARGHHAQPGVGLWHKSSPRSLKRCELDVEAIGDRVENGEGEDGSSTGPEERTEYKCPMLCPLPQAELVLSVCPAPGIPPPLRFLSSQVKSRLTCPQSRVLSPYCGGSER